MNRECSGSNKIFLAGFIVVIFVLNFYPSLIYSQSIILVHSNDTHGVYKPVKMKAGGSLRLVGGMRAASHYLNQLRKNEKNMILIDVGDIMTGTWAAQMEYKGAVGGAMVEFLNLLNYDIWVPGNHLFDRGQSNVKKLLSLAKPEVINANIIYQESGELFFKKPYSVLDRAGVKVGLVAVMEENFLVEVQREVTKNLDVLPILPTLRKYVPLLDRETDLIVVLVHARFEAGRDIARNIPGIDVVLVASECGRFEEINGVLVKSTYGHQKTLGYLKLEVEEDRVKSYQQNLVWLWADQEIFPSSEISDLVARVDESIQKGFFKTIGYAESDINREGNPVENPMGNLLTDAMCWKTGAQIGFQNSRGIRADFFAGPITLADVYHVTPFHNILIEFSLTAQQIKDALEYDIEKGYDRLQVSGLKYEYYSKNLRSFGSRVKTISVRDQVIMLEGRILCPEKEFSVVSNDYVVGHARDKYFGFMIKKQRNTGEALADTLSEYIKKLLVLKIGYENRIIAIDDIAR
ncbi:MAG: bifunctional metallophosphatase/5'-nucleotidase [Candidatus Aminicenantes bacterium]|nr:bifunctional metallophosphatase/5'-nucleotidase [Candidatus Aminicenantes bacterium]